MRILFAILTIVLLTNCGRHGDDGQPSTTTMNFDESEIVVRAQASLGVSVSGGVASIASIASNYPLNVVSAPSSTMTVDASKFKAPAITTAVLSFGNLLITALSDNDLNVCGPSKNVKCGNALLRLYTTGVAGPGLFNSIGGYGAPMQASLTKPLTVGLGVAGAAVMQQIAIPAGKNVVALKDFSPAPNYAVTFDFSNAGAGSYSTTVVLEYALAP